MISPEEAERLARRIVALYSGAEEAVIRALARRLGRGLADDDWAAQRLLELTALRRQVRAEVIRLQRAVPAEVGTLVADSWAAGTREAAAELAWKAPFKVSANAGALAALEDDLAGKLTATSHRILRTADDVYRSVVYEVSKGMLGATATRRTATQAALDRFAQRGVTGFTDTLGRNWSLSSYTEMACRTTAAGASLQAKSAAYAEAGEDLVIVSDAPGECGLCRPWEGRVLSLSGESTEHPSLAEARDAGLFHPNCRHNYHLYQPGVTRQPTGTEDSEGDAARQQQRYLERGIRSWKLREAAALDEQAARYAKAKQREWQARLRRHIDETGGKRLRYRESIAAERRLRGLEAPPRPAPKPKPAAGAAAPLPAAGQPGAMRAAMEAERTVGDVGAFAKSEWGVQAWLFGSDADLDTLKDVLAPFADEWERRAIPGLRTMEEIKTGGGIAHANGNLIGWRLRTLKSMDGTWHRPCDETGDMVARVTESLEQVRGEIAGIEAAGSGAASYQVEYLKVLKGQEKTLLKVLSEAGQTAGKREAGQPLTALEMFRRPGNAESWTKTFTRIPGYETGRRADVWGTTVHEVGHMRFFTELTAAERQEFSVLAKAAKRKRTGPGSLKSFAPSDYAIKGQGKRYPWEWELYAEQYMMYRAYELTGDVRYLDFIPDAMRKFFR